MNAGTGKPVFVQGTVVAADGHGLLILGPSGSGKSALALDLIALGALLVADDGVWIRAEGTGLLAKSPGNPSDTARIEARGIGILSLPAHGPVRLRLVADLGQITDERLPSAKVWAAEGCTLPCLPSPTRGFHPAALIAALRCGGPLNPDQPMLAHPGDSDEAAPPLW